MPKSYEQMNRQERTREYNRLSEVLKKQKAEKNPRKAAIRITETRMGHLHQLHVMDKRDDPNY